jgi:signal transduction histidine kinase/CheY-like chemotaxis protein
MNLPQAPDATALPDSNSALQTLPNWAVPIGVGLTYGLSGYLAQLLALPPCGQGPLQLQAGISLGCMLLWGGWRVLPAVLVAEWLLRCHAQPAGASVDVVLAACLVGGGIASLQAFVGAALVRRYVHAPLVLGEPVDVARFMLLGGFVACAASPVAIAAEGVLQGVPSAAWGVDALTGWLGQAFGACLAAPVVLALAGRPPMAWARRRLAVAAPLCIAGGLLVVLVLGVRHADRQRVRADFEREADAASSVLLLELLEPLRALEAMRDVFTASDLVTREGVRMAAKPWLAGPGHLQSIGFSTHVAHADIAAFERRVRADGVPGFTVFDRDDANSLRDSPIGDVFAMTYLEPPSRSASRLGLNSLSIQAARRAILETVRTGAPAATRSFSLTQAKNAPPQSGVVTYQAVYRGEPRSDAERMASVKGVALTTVRLDESLNAVLGRLPAGVSACVADVSAGEPRQRLAGPPGCEDETLRLSRVIPLPFAGRSWELRVNAPRLVLPGDRGGTAWIVSFTGMLAVAMLGALLLTVTGRAQRIEVAVEEARRARKAADLANAAKGVFLANMSHEIRTPMNAILGMSHLALKSGLNRQQHNYVAKVERSAKGLLGLIDNILDYAKMDAGKLQVSVSAFDLREVIAAVVESVAAKAEDKGLALIVHETPRMASAFLGDPLRLQQVLVNLAGNAIKFTERGEVLIGVDELTTDLHSCSVRFWVRDSGVGIADAYRSRLFRAFEQADDSSSRRFGGAGLGLATSQHVVRLMGGELELRSAPGEGSEFFFSLRFERQPSAEREVLVAPAGLAGVRVLVVDDSVVARRVLLEMAAPLGLLADSAADARDAVRAVRRATETGRAYDVVLVDADMAETDGMACARQLVRAARGVCPVALMTTAAGREALLQRVEASDLTVSDLLLKPVTPARLVGTCLAVLGLVDGTVLGDGVKTNGGMLEPLKGVRILLVEDNDINAELATDLLRDAGVEVTRAGDGRQALEALESGTFDAVLLDCQMPVMDGYQTVRAIRARPRWRSLPVIAMTANAMLADRHKALVAGMDDHIAKPINVNLMFETLWRWVGPAAERHAAVATPAVTEADEFATLAGIDARVGRASTMGNDRLYRRLLVKFRDTQSDFAAQFRAAAQTADALRAVRLVHDLRATAGALGAVGVERLARSLEVAFSDTGSHLEVETPLGALAEEIRRVNEGLRELAPD